ncbi:hypothetical protein BCR37DRAFT_198486 [Protomyces lactucae-debilis]|uniref:Uncharacterized protein n=1 Tax=Protomyces lactucae-debilis TaxID=2754530 RepID=A0A1Y2ETE2_PROLT|nr:uncharacterized protein BCR37DRAFT_198486 [Protomyces lactucae-debilis]ORY74574.1 hypothetical protein BCR37DRAFT_198486 [Protomyces lactucae-debilis]
MLSNGEKKVYNGLSQSALCSTLSLALLEPTAHTHECIDTFCLHAISRVRQKQSACRESTLCRCACSLNSQIAKSQLGKLRKALVAMVAPPLQWIRFERSKWFVTIHLDQRFSGLIWRWVLHREVCFQEGSQIA